MILTAASPWGLVYQRARVGQMARTINPDPNLGGLLNEGVGYFDRVDLPVLL
jgi:hypothetical protein